jgi:putative membrane protein
LKNKVLKYFLLISLLVVILWSYIGAEDRFTWWMESFPVLLGLPLLIVSREKFPLTPLLYCLIWIHMDVLLVGAHYTYAKVPLFDDLKDYFHFSRNHYDRIGHFIQGFVPAIIARELLLRTAGMRQGKWLFAVVTLGCLGISAIYELIEWATAAATGEAADAFLGTQGDIWDTQKDMLLALIGAVSALITLSRFHDGALKKIGWRPPMTPMRWIDVLT